MHCRSGNGVSQQSFLSQNVFKTKQPRGGGEGERSSRGGRAYVFETGALVVLEEAVLAAEVAVAEAAVADNALGRVTALLEVAADLLLRHGGRW